ncbi:4'-phosphopantetheinyl transferase family protein [Enterovirga rhinocerotis]|nr:4'-phosphopantetheinyl transferase superfamily protein [Enterovirga rhinocerotis]
MRPLPRQARPARARAGYGLSGNEVDVWLVDPTGLGEDDLSRCAGLLSPDERARWEAFAAPGAALQFLVARATLRTMLSRYADVHPSDWVFGANAHGRPSILEPVPFRGLRFNLSHTEGLVALALADGREIGVDVENTTRDLGFDRLAATVFAETEMAAFRDAAAKGDQRRAFYTLWTLKEAYSKARGLGLSLPLKAFDVDLSGAHPRLAFGAGCPDDPDRWRLRCLAPTAEHVLAVAVSVPDGPACVRVAWCEPGGSTTSARPRLGQGAGDQAGS